MQMLKKRKNFKKWNFKLSPEEWVGFRNKQESSI